MLTTNIPSSHSTFISPVHHQAVIIGTLAPSSNELDTVGGIRASPSITIRHALDGIDSKSGACNSNKYWRIRNYVN